MTRIEEIKARLNAATRGHWCVNNHGATLAVHPTIEMDDGSKYPAHDWIIGHMQVSNSPNFQKDANFIAAAPSDIAYLLSEIERLESQVLAATLAETKRIEGILRERGQRLTEAHSNMPTLIEWLIIGINRAAILTEDK